MIYYDYEYEYEYEIDQIKLMDRPRRINPFSTEWNSYKDVEFTLMTERARHSSNLDQTESDISIRQQLKLKTEIWKLKLKLKLKSK